MNTPYPFLIYGSYGYTGRLIAELAVQKGMRPLLAGRNKHRLAAQAQALDLDYQVFSVSDSEALDQALHQTNFMLHCAGPFIHTYQQVAQACLRTGRHYIDITGEIRVFESLAGMDSQARQAGVMLLPGAGYDVVPSDCLAAHLKSRMADASHLLIALRPLGSGFSRGTALTAIEMLGEPGFSRREGRLEQEPYGMRRRSFDFGRGPRQTISFSWGDVSTAYYSTAIPNIETYLAYPESLVRWIHISRYFRWLLRSSPARLLLRQAVKLLPEGPSIQGRQRGRTLIYAEATNLQGQHIASRLETPESYALTALSALLIAEKVLAGQSSPGFQTPAKAYGPDLILEVPGVNRVDIEGW